MMSQSVNAFDFNLNGTLQDTLIHRLEPRTPAPVVQHKSQQENAFGDLTEASRLVGLSDTAVDIWEGRKKVPVYGPNDDVSFHKKNFFEPDGKKVTFADTNYFSYIAEYDGLNTDGQVGSKDYGVGNDADKADDNVSECPISMDTNSTRKKFDKNKKKKTQKQKKNNKNSTTKSKKTNNSTQLYIDDFVTCSATSGVDPMGYDNRQPTQTSTAKRKARSDWNKRRNYTPATNIFDETAMKNGESHMQQDTYFPAYNQQSMSEDGVSVSQNAKSTDIDTCASCSPQAVVPSGTGSWVGRHHELAEHEQVNINLVNIGKKKRATLKKFVVDTISVNNPMIISQNWFYTNINFRGEFSHIHWDKNLYFSKFPMVVHSIIYNNCLFDRHVPFTALHRLTDFHDLVYNVLSNVIYKAIHNNHLKFLLFCNNTGIMPDFINRNFSDELNNEGRFKDRICNIKKDLLFKYIFNHYDVATEKLKLIAENVEKIFHEFNPWPSFWCTLREICDDLIIQSALKCLILIVTNT